MTGPRPRLRRLAPALLALLALPGGACDGPTSPEAPEADGGVAPDAAAAESGVAPPAAPEPPALTPCPEGWSTRFVRPEAPECEPWSPADGDAFCGFGERRIPGAGCVPLGSSCPADGWPSDLPPGAVHVSAAAAPGGDGSRDAPFASLAEALSAVGAEGTVALAAGDYEERITLDGAIELRGACPQETSLTSAAPAAAPGDAVITVTGAGAAVRDLAVRGASRAGVAVREGGTLRVEGLALYAVTGVGFAVAGELEGERVLIDGVYEGFGASRGVTVEGTGRATLRQVVIEGAAEVGAFSSAFLRLEDAVIGGQLTEAVPGFPLSEEHGVAVELGGTLELVRSLVERHAGAAARAGSDGHLVLEDTVLRANEQEGIRLGAGGRATLRRVTVGAGHSWGVLMLDGARLEAEDVVLRGAALRGLSVLRAEAALRRVLVAEAAELGIMVHGEGAALTAEDLVVADTRGEPPSPGSGRGLNVQEGATARVVRARFVRNRSAGVFVAGAGPAVTLRDVAIVDTRGRREDGRAGSGLVAQGGARVEAERVWIEASRGFGAIADAAELTLRQARVEGTRLLECGRTTCPETAGGTGMGAYRGGTLTADAFEVVGSPLCGIQVAEGAQMELSDGLVAEGLIGACVQVEGYDLSRLEEGVLYLENEVNLDSADQHVPESLVPAEPQPEP